VLNFDHEIHANNQIYTEWNVKPNAIWSRESQHYDSLYCCGPVFNIYGPSDQTGQRHSVETPITDGRFTVPLRELSIFTAIDESVDCIRPRGNGNPIVDSLNPVLSFRTANRKFRRNSNPELQYLKFQKFSHLCRSDLPLVTILAL
jgi:hypothetical protein